jgi:hypothetical protein
MCEWAGLGWIGLTMGLTSVPVIVELVLLHGNTRYVILVDVIQTLRRFDDWRSVSVRQEV